MNPHLFVYGTLLSRVGHPVGARLRRQARLLGEAGMPGLLCDLGDCPGLVGTTSAQERVYGELYKLNSPATTLKWLDAYEGIVQGDPDRNPYERVERTVRLATGEEIRAWVYLYRKAATRFRAIPGGRWVGHASGYR